MLLEYIFIRLYFIQPICNFSKAHYLSICKVLGESGVFFCDVAGATADLESTHWGIVNVRTAYLTEGDTMVLSNGSVTYADWKSNMQGRNDRKGSLIIRN